MPFIEEISGEHAEASIQRNLALLGLPRDVDTPLLEEFFNQHAEGRGLGLAEEEVRMNLATERGLTRLCLRRRRLWLSKRFSNCTGNARSYDQKAGAVHPTDENPGTIKDIARAIKSQTAEIAFLVKSHTDTTSAPSGTLKGLNPQSEETVFLLRACNQYQVTVGAGEHGQALANALLSAQIGASTKLRSSRRSPIALPSAAQALTGVARRSTR